MYKKFVQGLKDYGLTLDDMKDYVYAGGDTGRHYDYFNDFFKKELKRKPKGWCFDYEDKCICGHDIKENCYIAHKITKECLVLGNCCIKKYLPKDNRGKTCEKCNKPHKNRIVNRCNNCRYGICDRCDKIIDKTYHICIRCKFNKPFKSIKSKLSDNNKIPRKIKQNKPQEPISEYYYNMIQEL